MVFEHISLANNGMWCVWASSFVVRTDGVYYNGNCKHLSDARHESIHTQNRQLVRSTIFGKLKSPHTHTHTRFETWMLVQRQKLQFQANRQRESEWEKLRSGGNLLKCIVFISLLTFNIWNSVSASHGPDIARPRRQWPLSAFTMCFGKLSIGFNWNEIKIYATADFQRFSELPNEMENENCE